MKGKHESMHLHEHTHKGDLHVHDHPGRDAAAREHAPSRKEDVRGNICLN
jgi:hypothetical protein